MFQKSSLACVFKSLCFIGGGIAPIAAQADLVDDSHLKVDMKNLYLDRDFTTYQTFFTDLDGDGIYTDDTNEVLFEDDYNTKDKARSVWVSLNVRF